MDHLCISLTIIQITVPNVVRFLILNAPLLSQLREEKVLKQKLAVQIFIYHVCYNYILFCEINDVRNFLFSPTIHICNSFTVIEEGIEIELRS